MSLGVASVVGPQAVSTALDWYNGHSSGGEFPLAIIKRNLKTGLDIQFLHSVCRPGNREKLRYSQAELGPAIKSAVAYFASISGVANGMQELYESVYPTHFS